MKRFILCIAALLCLVCVQALAETDGLYTYEVNEDNTVTITKFDWNNNHGDIYIPEMLGNRMISAIGESSFATTGNTAVKITLPDNIKSIGAQAFRGVSMTYINIPLNTVEIGGGAFAQCSVMRFNVADGHTIFATIDNSLYNKQTKTLIAWPENKEIGEIPNGIKCIGDYAFYGRIFTTSNDLMKYVLPDSVDTVGEYAFADAKYFELTARGLSTIGENAFRDAFLNIYDNSISFIGDYAFYNAYVSFKTPLSLSKIGKYAFANAKVDFPYDNKLHASILSATPFEVDDYAFCNTQDEYYVSLKNITSVGAHAFEVNEDALKNPRLKGGWTLDKWRDSFAWSIVLKEDDLNNVTFLGESAFHSVCVSGSKDSYAYLTNGSLTTIPDKAFANTNITDLKVSSSVTSIGEKAFFNSNLKNVELQEGLLTIGDDAFRDCNELTAINIPASVNLMGNDIFTGCADTFVVTVEAGSYGEVWARTCGYAYVVNGQVEDTSWLD